MFRTKREREEKIAHLQSVVAQGGKDAAKAKAELMNLKSHDSAEDTSNEISTPLLSPSSLPPLPLSPHLLLLSSCLTFVCVIVLFCDYWVDLKRLPRSSRPRGLSPTLTRRQSMSSPSHHTIPYHTIPYHTIPSHPIPYHTIPYHTIPFHTIPYHCIPLHCIF